MIWKRTRFMSHYGIRLWTEDFSGTLEIITQILSPSQLFCAIWGHHTNYTLDRGDKQGSILFEKFLSKIIVLGYKWIIVDFGSYFL